MQYCKNRLNMNVANTSDKQTKDDLNTEKIESGRVLLYRMQQASGYNAKLVELYREQVIGDYLNNLFNKLSRELIDTSK